MKLRIQMHQFVALLQVAILAAPISFALFSIAHAAELKTRSISISSSTIGAPARHVFSFTVPSTIVLGSISFEYCTNSPLAFMPCTPPAGLNLASMALSAQVGNTGFTIDTTNSTANKIVLTRTPGAANAVASSYTFSNIINPTTANQTSFVRLATYISNDATGAATDEGAVAFATTDIFRVDAYVPPFLIFCVGVTVTLNCNTATGTHIDIGELSKTITATASMQFSGATNDATGYTTYMNGSTMTSGNNIINPLTGGSSSVGTSQFGLNLRANSNPTVGIDPFGPGYSVATAGYNTPNIFRFVDGEALTNSPTSTDFKLFTASYIVNVPANQTPGVYATTMTITAIASF